MLARAAVAAPTTFEVGSSGMSAYLIDGASNPTLTLTRGQTYDFQVSAAGHPFWIATARGAGDTEANAFSAGVAGNGSSPGTVTFTVPASAPATLFYQCGFHDPMGGTLNIIAAAAVPASGRGALVALATLLLLLGAALVRRRARGQASENDGGDAQP